MSVVNDLYVKKRNVTWLERKVDNNEGRGPRREGKGSIG